MPMMHHLLSEQNTSCGRHVVLYFPLKHYSTKSSIFFKDLVPHIMSRSFTKRRWSCSHLTSSHGRQDGVINGRALKSTTIGRCPITRCSRKLMSQLNHGTDLQIQAGR